MNVGHWELNAEMFDNSAINDDDREHIAEQIREGFTDGQLIHEEGYSDDT